MLFIEGKCRFMLLLLTMLFNAAIGIAQTVAGACPANIGFENGTFQNWECFAGKISTAGIISLSPTAPIDGRHTLLQNTYPQQNDPYGNFPVNCPNGSGYSIRLGNSLTGGEAESVSYTFTIPANQTNYSIIYNYAVVLQNPNHQDYQQPKFTSKVFNVTDNEYVTCGSFEFVASANLPGFKLSSVGTNIYYKPWSPITINLYGYAGKTIRIEFTNNDCTLGGHFGYAYLDVNENCSSPISGNIYCNGASSLTLTAPFGFQAYHWFNADFTKELGTENILKLSPVPPPGTMYNLQIVPFPGLGCLDTLSTVIQLSPEGFTMNVADTLVGCVSTGVDLTAKSVTSGSTGGLTFSYFTDLNQLNYVPTPKMVTTSGVYYIKGVNRTGCNDIKPVTAIVKDPPHIVINDPPSACAPNTVDITNSTITAGSEPNLKYSYFSDAAATKTLPNPTAVSAGGTYFIQGTFALGCSNIMPVNVTIGAVPNIKVSNPTACGEVDVSSRTVVAGSDVGLKYSYWTDASCTVAIPDPAHVLNTGNYFIKGTTTLGCSTVKPVLATVNPFTNFTVKSPITVKYPAVADLTSATSRVNNLTFTYWKDALAVNDRVVRPAAVDVPGNYYIRGKNEFGCSLIQPVMVIINAPDAPEITAPNAFSPNGDGINDLFKLSVKGVVGVKSYRIYNRWGQQVFEAGNIDKYWDGTKDGKQLPLGTYYWVVEGIETYTNKPVTSSGSITLMR
jgi:gliding motility-associated-like protein